MEDFIIDDEEWVIRYIVVDTRKWDKKVILSPQWCELVNWEESKINLDLTQDSIKDSPEFNPSEPVNREYEDKLYDYYGQPKYWVRLPQCGRELTIWQGKRISHIVGFATDSLKLGYPPISRTILELQSVSIRDKFNALRESRVLSSDKSRKNQAN